MSVTTPLQTFALLVTAEPHFLVSRPSQKVMLENVSAANEVGAAVPTTSAVHYFGNTSDYFRDPSTPAIAERDYQKMPSSLLQGQQAIALARYAGADRDAVDELKQAEDLLANADAAWKAGRDEDTVDITARQAISTAVKAESVALERKEAREKRNEKARTDAEFRRIEDQLAESKREIGELKAQLSAETRNRELSERDVSNFTTQMRELRAENGRLREDLGRTRVEYDNAKRRLEVYDNEKRSVEEQRERDAKLAQLQSSEPTFIQALRRFGTVAKTDRGIVLTLPESFWSAPRAAAFATAAEPKVTSLGETLANNPDYRISIESHTDDRGDRPEERGVQRCAGGRRRFRRDHPRTALRGIRALDHVRRQDVDASQRRAGLERRRDRHLQRAGRDRDFQLHGDVGQLDRLREGQRRRSGRRLHRQRIADAGEAEPELSDRGIPDAGVQEGRPAVRAAYAHATGGEHRWVVCGRRRFRRSLTPSAAA